jgi:hypothetical protein
MSFLCMHHVPFSCLHCPSKPEDEGSMFLWNVGCTSLCHHHKIGHNIFCVRSIIMVPGNKCATKIQVFWAVVLC